MGGCETNVPRPEIRSRYPSDSNSLNALRTVIRLTSNDWHNSVSVGMREPGSHSELWIRSNKISLT